MPEVRVLTLQVRSCSTGYAWQAQRACRQHWPLARMEMPGDPWGSVLLTQ